MNLVNIMIVIYCLSGNYWGFGLFVGGYLGEWSLLMSYLIDMMRYYVMDRYLVSGIIGIVILLLRCCRFLGGLLGVVVVVIGFGASPRASINMALAAKAFAFINHRGFVIPEDVRAVCPDVLRHRIGLTYEAEAEDITQADLVKKIMDFVEVP